MQRSWVVLALGLLVVAPVFATDRFRVEATLRPSEAQPVAIKRFAVTANLRPAPAQPQRSASGRFAMTAGLASQKSSAGDCMPANESVFESGFED